MRFVIVFFLAIAACAFTQPVAAKSDRTVRVVRFAPGASLAVVQGKLKGRKYVDYRVRAAAGQKLSVSMQTNHGANLFNVLPPDSESAAMFIGGSGKRIFTRRMPADGRYTVRVYLLRAAARRDERAAFTLSIRLSGTPLAALKVKRDARVPNTEFHATAPINCSVAGAPQISSCDAFVIRRGVDGTATVEVRWPQGNATGVRRILFVSGAPVVSDANEAMSHMRKGDTAFVDFGKAERFEIPDALVFGG